MALTCRPSRAPASAGASAKQDVLAAADAKEGPAAAAPTAAPAASGCTQTCCSPSPLAHLRGRRRRPIGSADHRTQDPRVAAADRSADPDPRGRHDPHRGAAGPAKEGVRRARGSQPHVPAVHRRAVIDALKAHPNVNASYKRDTKPDHLLRRRRTWASRSTRTRACSPRSSTTRATCRWPGWRAINDIAARARSGSSKPDEAVRWNVHDHQHRQPGRTVRHPDPGAAAAAMLGTGAIVKRPRVISDELGNESIGVRSVCYLPLTYDHRLIDGADAGRFLTTVRSGGWKKRIRGRPGALTGEGQQRLRRHHGSSGLIIGVGDSARGQPRHPASCGAHRQARRAALEPRQRRIRPNLRGRRRRRQPLRRQHRVINDGPGVQAEPAGQPISPDQCSPGRRRSRNPVLVNASAVGLWRHRQPHRRRIRPRNFPATPPAWTGKRDRTPQDAGVRWFWPDRFGSPRRTLPSWPLFASLGLGRRLAGGHQHAVDQPRGRGPRADVRARQPRDFRTGQPDRTAPVTNAEFTTALGRALKRPGAVPGARIRAVRPDRGIRRRGSAQRPAAILPPWKRQIRLPPQHHRRGPTRTRRS